MERDAHAEKVARATAEHRARQVAKCTRLERHSGECFGNSAEPTRHCPAVMMEAFTF